MTTTTTTTDRLCVRCDQPATEADPVHAREMHRACYAEVKRGGLFDDYPTRADRTVRTFKPCVDCSTTRAGRRARGMCMPCYDRHRSAGDLDGYVLTTPRRPAAPGREHADNWLRDAVCSGVDRPDAFFPHPNSFVPPWVAALCRSCPVRRECLAEAIADPSLEGYWGGTTVADRKQIRQRAGL